MSIKYFRGKYFFLSNFYYCKVTYNGLIYLNSEAAYQSMKVDLKERVDFTHMSPSESKIKTYGLKLENKDKIMYEIIKAKFIQNKKLKQKLLDTKNEEIIEGNSWGSTYWGICNGKGKNKLGKILMKIREELREDDINEI